MRDFGTAVPATKVIHQVALHPQSTCRKGEIPFWPWCAVVCRGVLWCAVLRRGVLGLFDGGEGAAREYSCAREGRPETNPRQRGDLGEWFFVC